MHIDDIGIFGGQPLFLTPRPIGQLAAPDRGKFLRRVRQAYDARQLGGNGRLVQSLEASLAEYHGTRHCIAVANAGLGLIAIMRLFAHDRAGEVIIPAFGYNGLPHFVQWAGQTPCFCDVEENSHGLDPTEVERLISDRTTSILAVSSFHDPGPIDELAALARKRGIPILFDSVNALGSSYRGRMLGGFGEAEVFSLHATKLLNGFEGGYITTDSDALAASLRERDGSVNARLNEVHAAMAIQSFEELGEVIARNKARFQAYERMCSHLPGIELLAYRSAARERSAFPLAVAEVRNPWPLTRDELAALLRAEGAAINAYYSPPLYRSVHAPCGLRKRNFPVAERLSRIFVQLPAGELVTVDDVERLAERLEFVGANGDEIARRLRLATVS